VGVVSRPVTAADLISATGDTRSTADQGLIDSMQREIKALRAMKVPKQKPLKIGRGKAAKHFARVIIPDSHGAHIDPVARAVFLADLQRIQPREIVMLGDHLDCAGTFSSHQASYTNELRESYDSDVFAANAFLDDIQAAAPNAIIHYIEGNHEQHVERWVARTFKSHADAQMVLGMIGPEGVLRLRERGITYYKRSEHYMNLTIPGTIRLGRVFFTHGISHSKSADRVHLDRFGASVVFGHVHRDIWVRSRTVTSTGHISCCPGTLAKLQPLYRHTQPTEWSHGYGLETVNDSTGNFAHLNIAILDGSSTLSELTGVIAA